MKLSERFAPWGSYNPGKTAYRAYIRVRALDGAARVILHLAGVKDPQCPRERMLAAASAISKLGYVDRTKGRQGDDELLSACAQVSEFLKVIHP